MAEVEEFTYENVAKAVIEKNYVLDRRMLLSFEVKRGSSIIERGWALNEISVERKSTTMLELFVQIDITRSDASSACAREELTNKRMFRWLIIEVLSELLLLMRPQKFPAHLSLATKIAGNTFGYRRTLSFT